MTTLEQFEENQKKYENHIMAKNRANLALIDALRDALKTKETARIADLALKTALKKYDALLALDESFLF